MYGIFLFVATVYSFMVLCRPSQISSVCTLSHSTPSFINIVLCLIGLTEIIKLWLYFDFMGFGQELSYILATECRIQQLNSSKQLNQRRALFLFLFFTHGNLALEE